MKIIQKIKNKINLIKRYRNFCAEVQSGEKRAASENKNILFDLKDFRLEYLYQIFYFFHATGNNIYLKRRFSFIANTVGGNSRIYSLPSIRFTENLSSLQKIDYLFTDFESPYLKEKSKIAKRIRISYDIYHAEYLRQFHFPVPLSHSMYNQSLQEELDSFREKRRRLKIFFSGNSSDNYKNPILNNFFGKNTRVEILNKVSTDFKDNIHYIHNSDEIFNENIEAPIVLTNWHWVNRENYKLAARVPNESWLNVLSESTFFLACSGTIMPMCYNLTEAMSVGTIPIVQYGEYLSPPLKHMENCLAFSDLADLKEKIKFALSLSEDEVTRIKKNVIRYYEKFLTPDGFISKLQETDESEIELFVHGQKHSVELALSQNRRAADFANPKIQ